MKNKYKTHRILKSLILAFCIFTLSIFSASAAIDFKYIDDINNMSDQQIINEIIKITDMSQDDINWYVKQGTPLKTILEVEYNVKANKNLPFIVKQAPYSPVIVATPDVQKSYLKQIDNFSISDTEKENMKLALIDIWNRAPDNITNRDYPVLEKFGEEQSLYFRKILKLDESNRQQIITPKWGGTGGGNVHGTIAAASVYKSTGNIAWRDIAWTHALDPDNVDEGMDRYYLHYYHPSVPIVGGAPGACLLFSTYAKNNYPLNKNSAYTYFGSASHYIADIGNPMHTDGPVQQYLNQPVHGAYEKHVSDSWSAGHWYSNIVNNNNQKYTVSNPGTSTQNLATYSTQFYSNLWNQVSANPTPDALYQNTILQTAKYNLGLAYYIKS